jgi:uncharacterized damage-inducible protein DinB
MTEIDYIGQTITDVFEGNAWYGPSLAELLKNVTAEQAVARPIQSAHNIHELVLHIAAWDRAAVESVGGKPLPQMPWSEDWQRIDHADEQEWQRARATLASAHRNLASAAAKFTPARLEEIVNGRKYNFRTLLHGMAQHAAYHAGQIALILKSRTS